MWPAADEARFGLVGVHVRLEPEARGSADGAGHENYEATHGGTNEKKKQGDAFEIGHGVPLSTAG